MDEKINVPNESEEKINVGFIASREMYNFLSEQAGEESISSLLRSWIREKMEVLKVGA